MYRMKKGIDHETEKLTIIFVKMTLLIIGKLHKVGRLFPQKYLYNIFVNPSFINIGINYSKFCSL